MRHAKGPLLSIDATERSAEAEEIDDVLADFVGGRGVGTKLACDRIPFDADPFGPDNAVYLTTGPMQFSRMSFTGRMNATGLSPLTDGLLSANAGGFLSRNFVDAGYAAVEITGESDELLALHVTDGVDERSSSGSETESRPRVEFEPVPALAGATVTEVDEYVAEERGLDAENVACVGPAGENRVRFASIMTTEHRAFGRGGLGAVLGAKNVKAITFEGDSAPRVELPDVTMDVHREAATDDHIMKRQGTTSVTEYADSVDALPSYYFSERSFEGAEGISGDRIEDKKFEKGTCSQCAFACKLPTRDEESGLETEGPEFETVMSFGSNAGIDDVVSVMKSNDLCDDLGLDTISAGDVVSAYLASEDEFGNSELAHETVEKIAHREGIGDVLAEGIARCHDELGVDDWTVKGLEFPGHDGRKLNGQGLSFAVANRGADHMYASFYALEYPLVSKEQAVDPEGFDGKAETLVERENHHAVLDSGIVCKFSRGFVTDERLQELLDADWAELMDVGARVVELERAFNNRRGMDRADDELPYEIEGFDDALDAYYEARGWNADGTVADGESAAEPADD